jgi:hypothetical protein
VGKPGKIQKIIIFFKKFRLFSCILKPYVVCLLRIKSFLGFGGFLVLSVLNFVFVGSFWGTGAVLF